MSLNDIVASAEKNYKKEEKEIELHKLQTATFFHSISNNFPLFCIIPHLKTHHCIKINEIYKMSDACYFRMLVYKFFTVSINKFVEKIRMFSCTDAYVPCKPTADKIS